MNINNTRTTPKSYFYTILYLDGYYPAQTESSSDVQKIQPVKTFEFSNNDFYEIIKNIQTKTTDISWIDNNTLYINHRLRLPITFEMWDNNKKPLFYCPILKDDISSVSIGGATIESTDNTYSLLIKFNDLEKPGENFFKIALRSIPEFSLNNNTLDLPTLDQKIQNQTGLAIIFRRPSMEALFDLIAEFDNSYWHSAERAFDAQYLTKISCYNNAFFETKYTNSLEDVVESIDTSTYKIQFSWDNIPNNNPVYV
jgi:hypothetical protein